MASRSGMFLLQRCLAVGTRVVMIKWVLVIAAVAGCMPLRLHAAPASSWGGTSNFVVGPGQYSSVQAAVDAAPAGSKIVLMAGTYREKVVVKKAGITLIGEPNRCTIAFSDSANRAGGTMQSATFTISPGASGFTAVGVTIVNEYGPNEKGTRDQQGVAVAVSADSSFYNCSILGWQDTLYADKGRQYYKTCVISGSVDFAFGEATAFFEDCTLYARKRSDSKYNSYTAQKRNSPNESGGFVFMRGMLDCDPGVTAFLGRGWGPYARTIFILAYMKDCIKPEGWGVFKQYKHTTTTFLAEYHCSGPGSDRSGRVSWSRILTDQEVLFFSNSTLFLHG